MEIRQSCFIFATFSIENNLCNRDSCNIMVMNKQMSLNTPRWMEVLVHVVAWLLIFGFPLVLMEYNSFIKWNPIDYLRQLRMPLAFGIVFYTNYFWLASCILFKQGRRSKYQGLKPYLF